MDQILSADNIKCVHINTAHGLLTLRSTMVTCAKTTGSVYPVKPLDKGGIKLQVIGNYYQF